MIGIYLLQILCNLIQLKIKLLDESDFDKIWMKLRSLGQEYII